MSDRKQDGGIPVMRSLERVRPWPLNPRHLGHYRGMEELREDIGRRGLDDAIHVWETAEADWIIKGHRRYEAMTALGWTECLQVVHHFQTTAEALEACLSDHGHTDPLDNCEKLRAASVALGEGLGAEATARALGVTPERVSLWYQLEMELPETAKGALATGDLSMNTAELLLRLEGDHVKREAVQLILRDEATGEPMSPPQAAALIEAKYLQPARYRRDWEARAPKLRKTYKVSSGYQFVEWDNRGEYVQGETGFPQPEFLEAGALVKGDALGRTQEALALELGVPVYVVAAGRHVAGHVRLVHSGMMREAAPLARNDETRMRNDEPEQATPTTNPQPPTATDDRRLDLMMKALLGGIAEALAENPTDAMTKGPWEPLLPFLAHLVCDVDAGAMQAWLGHDRSEDVLKAMKADTRNRAHLRWAILLLLCAESDASNEPLKAMEAVAADLGVDVK